MLSLDQGTNLVKLARKTVLKYFEKRKFTLEKVDDKVLNERRGVFVTIENYPDNSLRGCIGFPFGEKRLYEAVQKAAYSSAFEDKRFFPLKKEELNKVIFEVSVLTGPELIYVKDPKEYLEKIEIGRDGLIISNGLFSGLLLPQVALRFNWDVKEFLDNLCFKAGLTPDRIYDKNTNLWKFQTQVFSEERPNGNVMDLTEHSR